MSIAIKLMIAVGILLTYGLQLTVTTDLAWQGLRSKLVKSTGGSDSDDAAKDDDSSPKMIAYYYGMRFILILGSSKHEYSIPYNTQYQSIIL